MQNKFLYIAAAIVLALLPVLTSCGYRFTPVGGVVPEGMKTIAVPVFINGTNEPFVDTELTQAVVDEFLFDGRLKVVSLERADIVLRGKIIKFDLTALSYTADSHVQQYMVNISVNASVEDAKSKKILWREEGLSSVFVSSYPVALGDITATKIAKESAVIKACRDIAATLRSRVLEGF
jgi:outer membrane lipopolysaccharide assembly protein LptE/RlpB